MLKPLHRLVRHSVCSTALYHDFIRARIPRGGVAKIPLKPPKVIGIATSRGIRSYQEDAYAISNVQIDPAELQYTLKRFHDVRWDPPVEDEGWAGQTTFAGIYDGHGGTAVSAHLKEHLHGLFETVSKHDSADLVAWLKTQGGYFRRFQGGVLEHLTNPTESTILDLEARATIAFLMADKQISELPEAPTCGAAASVVLLHPMDTPAAPFYSSSRLAISVAHCGQVLLSHRSLTPLDFVSSDTRVLLCSTLGGRAVPMTQIHHPDARSEATRLRRLGPGTMTDSFGENRWMGALANTRGFGDFKFKRFGVTPEPEVRSKILQGNEWAYLVMFSDGISSPPSVLSDDEIVDLARSSPDPQHAAEAILRFAEALGVEDNATVIVVPLAGWGQITGPDKTKARRDFRAQQALGSERQRRM